MTLGFETGTSQISKAIGDFLVHSEVDETLLPKADEVLKLVGKAVKESEVLIRYRVVRQRMPRAEGDYIAPPEFSYTLHST